METRKNPRNQKYKQRRRGKKKKRRGEERRGEERSGEEKQHKSTRTGAGGKEPE
jgi:hypothetical protein